MGGIVDLLDLLDSLREAMVRGEIDTCIQEVEASLTKLPSSPFHVALNVDFTNAPGAMAEHFDQFIARESEKYPVAAVYTETNGFDINPGRWYCSPFAYRNYGGHDDYDWLSAWDSDRYPDMTLMGMEPLQDVYEQHGSDEALLPARDLATGLVLLKFQRLIQRSGPLMRNLKCPLLATAHEFSFICEYLPVGTARPAPAPPVLADIVRIRHADNVCRPASILGGQALPESGLVSDWRPAECLLKGRAFPDFLFCLGTERRYEAVFSERLREAVMPVLRPADAVQWLPVTVRNTANEERPYGILYVPDLLGALDTNSSTFLTLKIKAVPNMRPTLIKPVMRRASVASRSVFRIPEQPRDIYATRAFAEAVLDSGCRGMMFAPVASV